MFGERVLRNKNETWFLIENESARKRQDEKSNRQSYRTKFLFVNIYEISRIVRALKCLSDATNPPSLLATLFIFEMILVCCAFISMSDFVYSVYTLLVSHWWSWKLNEKENEEVTIEFYVSWNWLDHRDTEWYRK